MQAFHSTCIEFIYIRAVKLSQELRIYFFHFYHLFTSDQLKWCHLLVYKGMSWKHWVHKTVMVLNIYLQCPKNSKSCLEFMMEKIWIENTRIGSEYIYLYIIRWSCLPSVTLFSFPTMLFKWFKENCILTAKLPESMLMFSYSFQHLQCSAWCWSYSRYSVMLIGLDLTTC